MSSNPPEQSKFRSPEQFKSLDEIRDFLSKVENDIKTGQCSFTDLDFIPIFKSFQDLISQKNLDRSTQDLEKTYSIFRHKIEEIQTYINQIVAEDIFIRFLTKNGANDEILYGIMMNNWKAPLTLEDLSVKFFSDSMKRLSKSRNYTKNLLPEPDQAEEIGTFNLNYLEKPFEKSVNEFFNHLKNHMPCNLIEFFRTAYKREEFYKWFIYCLHLIQKHRIFFDKRTGIISEFVNDAEDLSEISESEGQDYE